MAEQNYSRLDDYWPGILDMLKAGRGHDVREQLQGIARMDTKLFNGLYWMVDKWLASRILIKGLSDEEIKLNVKDSDIGRLRMAAYLDRIKNSNEWWQTNDLPRILSEIDDEAQGCANVR